MRVVVTVPRLKVVSTLNRREHWRLRYARGIAERDAVAVALLSLPQHEAEAVCVTGAPLRVRFVRIGGREMDDDNLAGAFKACRDQVAKWLGRDDGPRGGIAWSYAQEKGKVCAVRIELEVEEQTT